MMRILGCVFVLLLMLCCGPSNTTEKAPVAKRVNPAQPLIQNKTNEKQQLSDYGFFKTPLAQLIPEKNVYAYDVNTPLFSDYASKKRFVFLPEGSSMQYAEDQKTLLFEEGSVLIKNFFYPMADGKERIIETRLLVKEKGEWKPLNYVWNDTQTEAQLNYIGAETEVVWKPENGAAKTLHYTVPNWNQCKNCHISENRIVPLGLTVAQLNRSNPMLAADKNQLVFFEQAMLLKNMPEHASWAKMPVWNDPSSGSLNDRAKAYLDANCAHCHQPKGSAKNSGLHLNFEEINSRSRGIFKPPVAAGKGSGELQYSIVPGDPEHSILLYRMQSTDPSIQMPEIGRSLAHSEGIELISAYIKALRP